MYEETFVIDQQIERLFPCHKNHKYNSYYEGNMDFYTCPVRSNLKSKQK